MKANERLPLTKEALSNFSGTTTYYRWICNMKITDGAKYAADNGASWALDIIASLQTLPLVKKMDFQCWSFRKLEDESCEVYVEGEETPGETKEFLVQRVPYTNLPVYELRFYCQNKVIFLPSEY